MEKYVISISRQFGSMGGPIAKRLSELLGIKYYDREIVEKAAGKLLLPVSVASDAEEAANNHFFMKKYPLGEGTTDIQNTLFQTQQQIILDLADKESCIIVGRCSDFILQDSQNHISVFIYASYEERLRNCIKVLNMDKKIASKMIASVDKARESYHMTYAKFLPQDIAHKDFLINSQTLGVEGTAYLLKDMVTYKLQMKQNSE